MTTEELYDLLRLLGMDHDDAEYMVNYTLKFMPFNDPRRYITGGWRVAITKRSRFGQNEGDPLQTVWEVTVQEKRKDTD